LTLSSLAEHEKTKPNFKKDGKVWLMVMTAAGEEEAMEFTINDSQRTAGGSWEYQLLYDGVVYKDGQYFAEADLEPGDP
jgi:hypothetical protein